VAYNPSPDTLSSVVAEIDRRIYNLETTPVLQASTIANGTLQVVDENLVAQVYFGLLPDGTYGVAVLNSSGRYVDLNAYAFGTQSNQSATGSSVSTTGFASFGGGVITASLGNTGTAIVTYSVSVETTLEWVAFGLAADGVLQPAFYAACGSTVLSSFYSSAYVCQPITLTPGSHTFEIWGWVSATGSGSYANTIQTSNLVVQVR
jgi:hypothetical protein